MRDDKGMPRAEEYAEKRCKETEGVEYDKRAELRRAFLRGYSAGEAEGYANAQKKETRPNECTA